MESLATKQTPRWDDFTTEFHQTLKEESMSFLTTLWEGNSEKEEILPNSFYYVSLALISKPDKDTTKKRKLQTNIPDEHRCKNS
jgi:DNA replication initiation complex subunit (GINS family)